MDAWHDEAVSGVLTAFRDQASTSLVLDIANLVFAGMNGATSMVNVLRALGPQMSVHVVASGSPARVLNRAELGPSVKLYASTDELAEYLTPGEPPLTSRWLPQAADDNELPLAA